MGGGFTMNNSFFEVLKNDFEEIFNIGMNIENQIYTNPGSAVKDGRLFVEKLTIKVAEFEEQEYTKSLNQYERLRILNKEGIIDDNIIGEFDYIRIMGNKASHEGTHNDIEYSVRIHKKLYIIVKWFFEAYGSDYNVTMPPYKLAEFPKVVQQQSISINDIDSIFKKRIEEYIESINKKQLAEEKGIERDLTVSSEDLEIEAAAMKVLGYEYKDVILAEETKEVSEELIVHTEVGAEEHDKVYSYTYKRLKGSYLLNELSKLSDSAKEAVECCKELDAFKKYLHVERSIQGELVQLISEANESNKAQLILFGGSVGDGKSHLLAYINEEYNDMVRNFKVHNDATESFDPNLTEIETLKEVLCPFNDENIDVSNEKLILAINLGVLNNFLEEEAVKVNYTKLISFIEESNIFNQEKISKSSKNEHFKLVSFGDYNIYELTKDGPESHYIEEILNNIIQESNENPFFNAFRKDFEDKVNSPIIENYKILSKPGVVSKITKLIIASMVKYKKILGTRELLNFIYEILVPANIEEFDITSSSIDCIDVLLPNILFNSRERGPLLKVINKEDPLRIRHEEIDKLIIKLNITTDIRKALIGYFDKENIEFIDIILGELANFSNISDSVKQKIIDTIIRLLYLVDNDKLDMVFEEEAYRKFMKYLYYYNNGLGKNYKVLFEEVEKAVFNWNGYTKNYIYLNEKLQNFRVAEYLQMKPTGKYGMCAQNNDERIERFKTNISLGYEILSKNIYEVLKLDYQLYRKLVDVNKGYHANKNDREEAVIFDDFIDKLLAKGNMENELLIEDKRDKKKFTLIYENDFEEEFIFERVDD